MAEAEPGLLAQLLGRAAYEFAQVQPMLPTYLHLIVSALFPIYTGAHASLSRPSSAARPPKRKRSAPDDAPDDDDDDDDDDDEQRLMEGLSPTDAILMPLFAGTALASLYFLLKWLEDPALLNKILNAYFAVFGVFSVSRLITDMLDIGHSLVFPRRYARRGALYHVHAAREHAVPVAGHIVDKQPNPSPLPGFLAALPLPDRLRRFLWDDRAMPASKWTLSMYLHRVAAGKVKIGPHGLVGLIAGLVTVAYFNLVDKPWYLTNLLGFGFSYGALQLMSPTTFATASLILSALFFYDIYFVFFTPMMVTVAKSLDVPIKLMFPRPVSPQDPGAPPSHAMLGLGDVVLPGIVIGLALRFDLYLFYLRQQVRIPATSTEPEKIEKPVYHSLAGKWSDHFWSHSLNGRPLWTMTTQPERDAQVLFTFPKTYFKASLVGYVLGLLATLGVMMIWNHAQPALLYLVPGVLGSLWLTALFRGELDLMWNYTEEIEDEGLPKEASGAMAKEASDKVGRQSNASTAPASEEDDIPEKAVGDEDVRSSQRSSKDREFFSLSIEAPWSLKKPASSGAKSNRFADSETVEKTIGEPLSWVPSKAASSAVEAEPVGKRLRLR
ncbi:hypothetical protein ACN47E_010004 [Coniothyrium glycines]